MRTRKVEHEVEPDDVCLFGEWNPPWLGSQEAQKQRFFTRTQKHVECLSQKLTCVALAWFVDIGS